MQKKFAQHEKKGTDMTQRLLNATLTLFAVALVTSTMIGCSMCCGPYDFDYPTFGGKFQRADPAHGRVGSLFSDPYANTTGPSADSNLEPHVYDPPNRADDESGDDSSDDVVPEANDSGMDEIDEELRKLDMEGQSNEPLPEPEEDAAGDGTASRSWQNKPLRRKNWR